MHLLPILWTKPPTEHDWAALRGAKEALGFTEGIQPARAVPGSPGRILVVGGKRPEWLTTYAQVPNAASAALVEALGWCLGLNEYDEAKCEVNMISDWLGVNVTLIEEIEWDDAN